MWSAMAPPLRRLWLAPRLFRSPIFSSSRSVTARLIACVICVLVMYRICFPGSQYEPRIVVGSAVWRRKFFDTSNEPLISGRISSQLPLNELFELVIHSFGSRCWVLLRCSVHKDNELAYVSPTVFCGSTVSRCAAGTVRFVVVRWGCGECIFPLVLRFRWLVLQKFRYIGCVFSWGYLRHGIEHSRDLIPC